MHILQMPRLFWQHKTHWSGAKVVWIQWGNTWKWDKCGLVLGSTPCLGWTCHEILSSSFLCWTCGRQSDVAKILQQICPFQEEMIQNICYHPITFGCGWTLLSWHRVSSVSSHGWRLNSTHGQDICWEYSTIYLVFVLVIYSHHHTFHSSSIN